MLAATLDAMDLGVRDRGYLVVGRSAGMGLAAAKVLAEDGARVAVTGRDAERARAAVERIGTGRATAVVGDVSRDGEADRIVSEAVDAEELRPGRRPGSNAVSVDSQ